MKAFVVVATKGRPIETFELLNYLAGQTYAIEQIIIVGSEQNDIKGLDAHPLLATGKLSIKTSPAGSCKQRNVGLDALLPMVALYSPKEWFVVIFDDDFRPANNWIEKCAATYAHDENLVGVGGWVIADGATTSSISEQQAQAYLTGKLSPVKSVWDGTTLPMQALYGCNMSFRGTIAATERFDENLPLYGWQEDIDYGARATKQGQLVNTKECTGVHLGVSGGRTSGVRFGYSQIANPLYLVKKGTMVKQYALKIALRNIASNSFKAITLSTKKDYRGRLYGNALAIKDILKSTCHPTNILDI